MLAGWKQTIIIIFLFPKKVWVLTVSLLFENSKCKEVILSFAGRMETNHYCRMLKVTSGNAFQKWPQGLFKNNIYSLLIFKTTYFHYSRNIFIIFFPNIIFTFSFSKQHMFIIHFFKQHIFTSHFQNNTSAIKGTKQETFKTIYSLFIFKTTYIQQIFLFLKQHIFTFHFQNNIFTICRMTSVEYDDHLLTKLMMMTMT